MAWKDNVGFETQVLKSGPYPDQQWPMSGSVTFSDTQAIVDVGGHKRLTLEDTGPLVLRDEEGKASLNENFFYFIIFILTNIFHLLWIRCIWIWS